MSSVLLCVIFFGVWSFLDADQEISALEKRTLAQVPDFSLATLFAGDFTRDYESYYADNFPRRDGFITLSYALNHVYYFDFGQNTVIVGRREVGNGEGANAASPPTEDDPLTVPAEPPVAPLPKLIFPTEDEVIQKDSILLIGDRAVEIPYTVPDRVTRYAAAINLTQTLMPGRRVISLIIPNGAEFYSPEKFHSGPYSQKDMITLAYSQMDPAVFTVDAYTRLREKADQYLYFRTDHHWTARGAYQAYFAYCESLGFKPVPLESFSTGRYENFVGSMYNWTSNLPQSKQLLDHPDYVEYFVPLVESTAAYYFSTGMTAPYPIPVVDTELPDDTANKYLCFIRGDTPLCQIITANSNGKKCIVFKESYGNAFIPFLTSHYDEIYVVDPRLFNTASTPAFNLPSFVNEHDINDIVFINYSFIPNNSAYIAMIENMLN
ncbi:MAG: hypothetical protein LBT22_05445 [Peptococcaceae bacterium]|nr:hypothetical protein [Peptococcaceae bacterium]